VEIPEGFDIERHALARQRLFRFFKIPLISIRHEKMTAAVTGRDIAVSFDIPFHGPQAAGVQRCHPPLIFLEALAGGRRRGAEHSPPGECSPIFDLQFTSLGGEFLRIENGKSQIRKP
jgi:hypothetical protein